MYDVTRGEKMKGLKILSIISVAIMIFVLVGGALVTKTDSGMGCGANWPLCYGDWSLEMFIELSHRIVSSLAGIFILLLSILSWRKIGHIREVKFLSFISIFFLIAQGLFGASAVIWPQSDTILALHFGVSLISFAAVLLLTILIFEVDHKFDADSLIIPSYFRKQFIWLAIFTYVVVYSGALVRHMDSSLACPDWPFCVNNDPLVMVDWHIGQWVQMGHRFLAAIAFIWTIVLMFQIKKHFRHSKIMYNGWMIQTGFMVSQVLLGALVIFSLADLTFALLHALIITLYFGVLCYYLLLSYRSVKKEKQNKS